MHVVLSSLFPNGFNKGNAEKMTQMITKRDRFVFIASNFENISKSEEYYEHTVRILREIGITFAEYTQIDCRISKEEACEKAKGADVLWLSGGITPLQYHFLEEYGLSSVIQNHQGVIIGLSAGAINLCKTALCTVSCGHLEQSVYPALGCVEFSVEPHFSGQDITEEQLALSEQYPFYGLCDESMIVCDDDVLSFYGDVYCVNNRSVVKVENEQDSIANVKFLYKYL